MLKSYLSAEQVGAMVAQRRAHVRDRVGELASLTESANNFRLLQSEMRSLTAHMFDPPSNGDNFAALRPRQTALLNLYLSGAAMNGRFVELHAGDDAFPEQYATLYANANLEPGLVPPEGIDAHSNVLLDSMFQYVTDRKNDIIPYPNHAHILVIWRAACAALDKAHQHGFRRAMHVAMTRGHGSQASIYYRGESIQSKPDPQSRVLVWDPMIATAWSMHLAILELEKLGVSAEQISVAGMFVAPEGLVRLLQLHPNLRKVIACRLEGGMDENAYLHKMRVGDYGDLVAGSFVPPRIASWEEMRMMTRKESVAFRKRMRGESLAA